MTRHLNFQQTIGQLLQVAVQLVNLISLLQEKNRLEQTIQQQARQHLH